MTTKATAAGYIVIDDTKSEIKVVRGGLTVQTVKAVIGETFLLVKHGQTVQPGVPLCI